MAAHIFNEELARERSNMSENFRTNPDYPDLARLRLPPGPRRLAVYRGLRSVIESGELRSGSRLPPTRELARSLHVARGAVVAGYEMLIADGFAEARVGAGTFVAEAVPNLHRPEDDEADEAAPPTARPGALGVATPDRRTHDILRRLVNRSMSRVEPRLFQYGDPQGDRGLREAVADYLRAARGVRCTARNVMITSGTQQGLDLAIRTAIAPGSPVWMENPCYPMARLAMEGAGLRLTGVPVDSEGLDVAAGMRLCPDARAAYVTPSHQFPLGVAMTMRRRLALVDWARRSGAWIIEDDYDSEFRYAGPPLTALQGMDNSGQVIYLGTFSKVLFPGLRLGYAVVPDGLLDRMRDLRARTDRFPTSVLETALAEFLRGGHFSAHIRRARRAARAARDVLVGALAGIDPAVRPPDQGLHLICGLPDGVRDAELVARLDGMGLGLRALSPLYLGEPKRRGLVIGFSGWPPETLKGLAATLGAALAATAEET